MTSETDFRLPATYKIYVDSEEIEELYPYLVEVRVNVARGKASVCSLVLDTVRLEDETWKIQDSGVFKPWAEFKIEAEFGDHSEEIMRGYVKAIQSDIPEKIGESKVTIVCQDETMLLNREHKRKVWSREDEQVTDGDIATEIGSAYNLEVEAEDGLTNVSLSQDGTDVHFLKDRAGANGFEFYIRESVLVMQSPQLSEDPQPSIMVYSGPRTNCLSFSVAYDGHKPDAVGYIRQAQTGTEIEQEVLSPNLELLGTDAATSETSGLEPFVWQLKRPKGSTLEEVISRAQAKANENAWKIKGQGILDGTLYGHVLQTHKVVGVYGVGDTDSGHYYVDSVNHEFGQNGYRQNFVLLRNATGKNSEPEEADSLAGVR